MRILWLKTELLHPVDKGGRIRTYNMLRELRREHHVTYLALDDGTAAPDARERAVEYCHELVRVPHHTTPKFTRGFYVELAENLVSPLPYFMKKYESREMRRKIVELTTGGDFDVVVCDFLQPSVNVPDGLPCASVLFQHNVEAMIWRRHYEVQANPVKKAYLYGQWRKSAAYERKACRSFDVVVAVSTDDAEVMRGEYGAEPVADIPTGVDTDYFRPSGEVAREPHHLVFTGSMDWLPNEDAMRFFVEDIMPRVRGEVPDVRLTIVGRNPPQSLVEMAGRESSVEVTGRVEDVRPYMERASVFVVPIRIGGGTRLKIYESMAMERPIVSTTIGAEGLPVGHERELLLADAPEDFAKSVVRLLRNEDEARRLAGNAARLVREHYGWAAVARRFADICAGARGGRTTGAQSRADEAA